MRIIFLDLIGWIFAFSGLFVILFSIYFFGWADSYEVLIAPIIITGLIWGAHLYFSWPNVPRIFESMPIWGRIIGMIISIIIIIVSVGQITILNNLEPNFINVYIVITVLVGTARLMMAYVTTKYVKFEFED